jgi:hypothetical protein
MGLRKNIFEAATEFSNVIEVNLLFQIVNSGCFLLVALDCVLPDLAYSDNHTATAKLRCGVNRLF